MSNVSARITAPHFCCGIIFRKGVVVEAAPITKYMKGWTAARVEEYCKNKKWKVEVVELEH